MESGDIFSPLKHGRHLAAAIHRWNEGPDRRGLYDEHYREWVGELAVRLVAHEARLRAIERDRERLLVLGNYGLEAWREANDRRRAMLADAAEATVVRDMATDELARVERTIRHLDPEDLELLVDLSAARERFDNLVANDSSRTRRWPHVGEYRVHLLEQGYLGGAALLASGCVRTLEIDVGALNRALSDLAGIQDGPRFEEYTPAALSEYSLHDAWVTELGDLVLRFMGRRAAR